MLRALFLCFAVLFLVAGCKSMLAYKDDYAACVADPDCHAKMLALGSKTQTVVSAGAASIPAAMPFEGLLAQLFGMLATGLGGIMYGKKLRSVRSTDK